MKKQDVQISIIVPIYKVEKYLVRCVESLIAQDFLSLEIILIDDGSPDRCGEICDNYAKKDARIIAYHKPNGGLSDARNYGLERAHGEYVLFVDSDDYLEPQACANLWKEARAGFADIIISKMALEKPSEGMARFEKVAEERFQYHRIYSGPAYLMGCLEGGALRVEVIRTMFRRDFLVRNDLYFEYGILHEDEDSSKEILEHLPNEVIGDILDEEDDEELILEWLNLFSKYKQKQILDEVSHDVITDVIGSIEDEDEKNAFLELLEDDDKEDVKQLLQYNPETAGGIMTTEYLDIHANNTVKETLLFLQTTEEEPRHYLYVVDKDNVLKGVVSLGDIVTSTFDTQMLEITNQNVKAVYYYEDQEEVAKTFSKYGYILMPVIDEQHHLLGVIDIDDVMDVIEEETTEDMNLLGGVGSEERLDSTLVESFKNRIPWLIVNLFTAIMASSVVSVFEGTIAKVVALATISPIITGMGGNAGTQTLTIVVRGLSLGELDKENARKVLLKEIGLGILNGVIIGALVSAGAWFFAGNPWFGVVAGLAMICNMIVATLAGYFVPVILDRFHVDPALASGVFVTTCTDMFGFFAFLGLATILMSHLL